MSPSLRAAKPDARLGRAQPLGLNEPAPEPIAKNWPARIGALLLVCGGRDYADSAHVFGGLDALQPRAVVHGAFGVAADRPRRRGSGVEAVGAAPERSAALGGATQPGGMTT